MNNSRKKKCPQKTQIVASPLAMPTMSSSSDDDDEEEDDDDEESDSSSESCTSTSSFNSDSSSSSDSGSSDDDSDIDDTAENGKASCKAGTSAPAKRSKHPNANDTNTSWGFAAEAKKNFDIFRRSTNNLSERVFGNFDGVDKESLIKTSPHALGQNSSRSSAQHANSRAAAAPMFSNRGATGSDGKPIGRRKTKVQPHKDHHNSTDHHQSKDARADKKTEFSSFLKTKNNRKLNAFAVCDSSDAMDTKDLFTRPKTGAGVNANANTNANANAHTDAATTSSSISFGSNRGSNSSASISKVRLNNNHNSKNNKQTNSETRTHSKDTSRSIAAASLNNNSNSIRNNNTNCNASSYKSDAPRRVELVSLPLCPNSKNRYDSSSDDDLAYLTTPSTSHQSDRKYSLDFASLIAGVDPITGRKIDHHHRHGIRSIPDPLGMSSNYPMLSSLSPHTPPYNKNQSMGKNNNIHHKQKPKKNQKKIFHLHIP